MLTRSGLADFASSPLLRTSWVRDPSCQAARLQNIATPSGTYATQWGQEDGAALGDLEILPVKCGDVTCTGADEAGCQVMSLLFFFITLEPRVE